MSQPMPSGMQLLVIKLYVRGYTADQVTRMMNRAARQTPGYPVVLTKRAVVRAMIPLAIESLKDIDERAIEALKHIDEKAKVKLRIKDGYKVQWIEVEGLKPLVMLERLKESPSKAKALKRGK